MQFKDELKQQYGKFTDDDLRRIGGNYEKFIGKAQERYGEKIGRTHEVGGPVAAAVFSRNHEGKDGLPQYRASQSTLRSEKRIADVPVATYPASPFNIFRDCEQL
jgi:hypothetical protein